MGAEALRQPLAKTRKSGLSHFFDTLKYVGRQICLPTYCFGMILWILALYHFRFAIFLYSSGSRPVLLRNSSANRLDVEYPIV